MKRKWKLILTKMNGEDREPRRNGNELFIYVGLTRKNK